MTITGTLAVIKAYDTVNRWTQPSSLRGKVSVRDNPAVEVTISKEAKALAEAAEVLRVQQAQGELSGNEQFVRSRS
jgi:hypothetical protein